MRGNVDGSATDHLLCSEANAERPVLVRKELTPMKPDLNLNLDLPSQAKLYYRKQISSDRKRAKIKFFLLRQFMSVSWSVVLPVEKAEEYMTSVDAALSKHDIRVTAKIRDRLRAPPHTPIFIVTIQHLYAGDVNKRVVNARDFKPAHSGKAFYEYLQVLKHSLGVGNYKVQEVWVYSQDDLRPKLDV